MKAVRVMDLPDQFVDRRRMFLYCQKCGGRFSASDGDYFLLSLDHVFKHCRRNMVLASAEEVITIESS